MLEESLPSIWASVYSWFTPTVLFVLLNLMIGTIAISSGFGNKKNQAKEGKQPQLTRAPSVMERFKSFNPYHHRSEEVNPFPSVTTTSQLPEQLAQEEEGRQPQLTRTPSILERFKSFNLYRHRSQEVNPFPSVTSTLQLPEYQTMEQLVQEEETLDHHLDHEFEEQVDDDHYITRTKSDKIPSSGDMPVKLPQKMKKSASSKSAFGHFKEDEILEIRRPSTVKEGKSRASELQHFGEDDEVDAKADHFINKFKQQLKLQRIDSIIRYKDMLHRDMLNRGAN